MPAEHQKLDEMRLIGAYYTECLIKEIDRSHVDIGFKDLVNELKAFTIRVKDNLKES